MRKNTVRRADIARVVTRTPLAKEMDLSSYDVDTLLDEAFKQIRQNLLDGNSVELDDIGVLTVKTVPGRVAYIPVHDERTYVEEHDVVRFTPGTTLKKALRNKK
jgi:nucleoid DNA-binding protein